MLTRSLLSRRVLLVFAFCLILPLSLSAQVNPVPWRITQAIDETKLTVLQGNTHPMARAEFDRGPAPGSLPMERMLLVLKRSPEQEAALEKFMAEQQDKSSPNYHHWLSPQEFGQQFGPSAQDIQTITSWLASHGFQVGKVSNGRTVIEFTGTAAQVQEAFHTAIHKYVLPNGEQHWANSSDPAIPAALAPVVAGVHGLHNFFPKPLSHITGPFSPSQPVGQAKARPMYSFQSSAACSTVQSLGLAPVGNECFMVTPADLAVIYNIAALWNANPAIDGTGQTIAIVGDSNINIQDVRNFRSLMGLPAKDPVVILAGTDPGVQKNGDESEAVLDVEWSGSVAQNATLDLVIATSTNSTFGGDTAATFIVDNNLAPVLSESFGACERDLSSSGNAFYNNMWQQAAAEGITVLVSSGDNGSAACDISVVNGPASQPAQNGLQVNGLASTPFNVAVGGTDFDDVTSPSNFWALNSTSPTQASALGYVPETVWNDSCTNPVFIQPTFPSFGANAEAVCNNSQTKSLTNPSLIVPAGGSGGASGIYKKPSWQDALTPNDTWRDLPDVSLFAGTGIISASFYYLCESDLAACSFGQNAQIFGVGGTSVSTQVFAGIMALVNQKAGERQGNANSVLYPLAAQTGATCPSAASPASNCMFYDVTTGTNAMPCAATSPNCNVTPGSGDLYGVLSLANGTPAYNAAAGYNLAAGLGSVNAANLVNATDPGDAAGWPTSSNTPDFSLSSSGAVTVLGNSGTLSINISAQNGFNTSVSLSCTAMPAGDTCSFNPSPQPMISGTTPITVTINGAALIQPANRPRGWRAPGGGVALFGALLTAIFLLSLRGRPQRWSAALAVVAFVLLIGTAACGGGSSSGGGGGGGGGGGSLTAGTGVVVATGGGVTHSMAFTIP